MPPRPERFMWVYLRDSNPASVVDAALRKFANGQRLPAPADLHWSTEGCAGEQLWLLRVHVGVGNQPVARAFRRMLRQEVNRIRIDRGLPHESLLIRTNLLTPLIVPPVSDPWPITDFGLHPVNDEYNGMLATFSYHEDHHIYPPHLQASMAKNLFEKVSKLWEGHACYCRDSDCPECGGIGCFSCFHLTCPDCQGTGWRGFSQWAKGGYQVNYSSRYPLAH